jgi:hypothetical protein
VIEYLKSISFLIFQRGLNIMLLYTKVITTETEEGKKVTARKIFGTLGNIPAETDEEVIYKDADGTELELEADDIYLDGGSGKVIRKSDGKEVQVFVGDVRIIPAVVTEEAEEEVNEG